MISPKEFSMEDLLLLRKALAKLLWSQEHTCQPSEIRNPTAALYGRMTRLIRAEGGQ